MYLPVPSEQELAVFGLSPDDYAEWVTVWPDVWSAVRVFDAMATQWRQGAHGASGLDYTVLAPLMDLFDIPPCQRLSLFQDLRVLEAEALWAMNTTR